MSVPVVTPQKLDELRRRGETLDLVDVRTPAEFREIHADLARNVPLETLDPQELLRSRPDAARPLYVICRSGSRGRQACEKILAAGTVPVVNVEGGTLAWEAAGLPVVRGRRTISLERQVRIVAGALVVAGTVAGWFFPLALAIPAFVGAGLVFAGVTDTCGMALILARMPWNQVGPQTPAGTCPTGACTT